MQACLVFLTPDGKWLEWSDNPCLKSLLKLLGDLVQLMLCLQLPNLQFMAIVSVEGSRVLLHRKFPTLLKRIWFWIRIFNWLRRKISLYILSTVKSWRRIFTLCREFMEMNTEFTWPMNSQRSFKGNFQVLWLSWPITSPMMIKILKVLGKWAIFCTMETKNKNKFLNQKKKTTELSLLTWTILSKVWVIQSWNRNKKQNLSQLFSELKESKLKRLYMSNWINLKIN